MTAINSAAMSIAALQMKGFSATQQASDVFASIAPPPKDDNVYTSDLAAQRAKLDQYLAERDAAAKAKYGDAPPDTIAVAMPMDVHGRTPFVNAGQQKIIDAITEKYAGKGTLDGLEEELKESGVHPDQILAGAEYFVSPGGNFTDKRGRSVNSSVNILV